MFIKSRACNFISTCSVLKCGETNSITISVFIAFSRRHADQQTPAQPARCSGLFFAADSRRLSLTQPPPAIP